MAPAAKNLPHLWNLQVSTIRVARLTPNRWSVPILWVNALSLRRLDSQQRETQAPSLLYPPSQNPVCSWLINHIWDSELMEDIHLNQHLLGSGHWGLTHRETPAPWGERRDANSQLSRGGRCSSGVSTEGRHPAHPHRAWRKWSPQGDSCRDSGGVSNARCPQAAATAWTRAGTQMEQGVGWHGSPRPHVSQSCLAWIGAQCSRNKMSWEQFLS